jgi:DivIVA domain-containing protein
MKKKDTSSQGSSEWSSAPTGRITPADVQQKEFRVARFGAGYRVREVDEFLDQVTDALQALIQENERLLGGAGGTESPSSARSIRPATSESDRAAVDAFLRREKGFLQDLGELVQAHAEELRSMIRTVRREAAAPAAEEPRAEPAPAPVAVPEARTAAMPEATYEPGAPPEEASTGPEEAVDVTHEAAPDDGEDGTEATAGPPTTRVIADEPIRLEEPKPARSKRSDDDEGGSLRELFWGEE